VAMGWVCICWELQCDKVNFTYGGEDTIPHCISDSLLDYRSKIPPAKNPELHCKGKGKGHTRTGHEDAEGE